MNDMIISINWNSIIENSISGLIGGIVSGLIVGLFISFIGNSIWRKQYLFTKKNDSYNEIMPNLHLVIAYIKQANEANRDSTKCFDRSYFAELQLEKLLPSVQMFSLYFGEEYINEYQKLTNIYMNIIRKNVTYLEEEIEEQTHSVLSKFYYAKKNL